RMNLHTMTGPTGETRHHEVRSRRSRRRPRRRFAAGAALSMGLLLSGCAEADDPDVVHVTVTSSGFDPALTDVTPGTEVPFWNGNSRAHTVTTATDEIVGAEPALPEGAEAFDSGRLLEGEAFSLTFDVAGDHVYWCEIHRDQQWVGVIRVGEQ